VNGFALWVGLGTALGLWRAVRGVSPQQASGLINIALFLLMLAFIGARLFYVGINWDYFAIHAAEIPQFWRGGLAWPGAIAGAWLALLSMFISNLPPRGRRVSLGVLSDRLYPLLAPVCVTAWLGSWQIGTAYGFSLPAGTWWAIPGLDETGYNLHWPLQPLAALTLLIFFTFLEAGGKIMRQPGQISAAAVLGLLLHLLAASMLRGDPEPHLVAVRLDVLMALIYLVLFVIFLVFYNLIHRSLKKHSFSKPRPSS
jgi:prolipoprotein diacylglyceryltransferase